MSQSLLLKIARESITEVFEAQNIIDRKSLLIDHPILNEPLAAFVSLYIDKELRGESGYVQAQSSLLEEIIYHAKTAAFQDKRFEPLKVSEYLQTQVELSLLTPLEEIPYLDVNDLYTKIKIGLDGIYISTGTQNGSLLPSYWSQYPNTHDFIMHLLHSCQLNESDLLKHPKVYRFQVEKSRDEPILK